MARMQIDEANEFRADLRLAEKTVQEGVTAAYNKRKSKHWVVWLQFCSQHKLDPFLSAFEDPVPILQVFGQRYRDGRLSLSGSPVSAKTAIDAIRSVGQGFLRVGTQDPRLGSDGSIDFRLARQGRAWTKLDPPPARVKPVPATIVLHIVNLAHQNIPHPPCAESEAIADIICIAFFFLLRPSEYAGLDPEYSVFTLDDVHLYLGQRKLDISRALVRELESATSMRLHFTTQKNQDKGDVIAHA